VISLELDNLHGYPLVVADSKLDKFTRSSNINQLHALIRPEARFLVVDIDMQLTEDVLKSVMKYVSPGVAYFPIVWSQYSPMHVARVPRVGVGGSISLDNRGTWRQHGYGMYALHAQDLARFHMDESFVGWGGEDNEFHERVKRDPDMTIVREKERGLIHVWHDKNCSQVIENPLKRFSCLGSKAAYLG
jgi:chondroitin sulfate synthase